MQASLVDQRRYLSENARSRLRGSNACLRTVAPTLPVRVPSERAGVFLLDHSQVGFAVIFINDISFFCVETKKARDLVKALGLGFGWVQPSKLYICEICVDTNLINRSGTSVVEIGRFVGKILRRRVAICGWQNEAASESPRQAA